LLIIKVDQAGNETYRYFKDDQEIDEHEFHEVSWRGYYVNFSIAYQTNDLCDIKWKI
jgi:hypothetical protein